MKIEEVNVVTHKHEDDIFFVSSLDAHALVTDQDSDMTTWIINSSASFHVTPQRESFCSYNGGSQDVVHLGNNYACSIARIGDVKLVFFDGMHFMLHDVRHVPKLKKNIVSTGHLYDQGYYKIGRAHV